MDKKEFEILEERWMSLNVEEKEFIVEFLKAVYPEKTNLLTEARWWNTVGDIIGIFDPTGIVDLINGLDYIRQGDYFFGFLSMISVIPYVGDAVAKPLMFLGKGSKVMKGVNEAMKLSKAGKVAEAGKVLEAAGSSYVGVSKLLRSANKWADKLKKAINVIPGGKLTGGLRRTLTDWIDLFAQTGKKAASSKAMTKGLGKTLTSQASKLSAKEATQMIKTLKSTIKTDSKIFKNFKPTNPSFMAKYFWPGATVGILWRNRALTGLVRRTKWYAGLLDFLGLGNWVGPEELSKQFSPSELDKKFQEYVSSKEGQKNWSDEFGSASSEDVFTKPTEFRPETSAPSTDPFGDVIMNMFGGAGKLASLF